MGIYHLLKDYWEAEPCIWEHLGLRREYLSMKSPQVIILYMGLYLKPQYLSSKRKKGK